MSLYNLVHGVEPTAQVVLDILQIAHTDVPRFRDAYVTYRNPEKTEPVLVLLTRTGGGNRPDFVEQNASLRQLPGYLRDVDDEFDNTFALFSYSVPEPLKAALLEFLTQHGEPLTLRGKNQSIDSMKSKIFMKNGL